MITATTTRTTATTPASSPAAAALAAIDMCTPAQVCRRLRIDEGTLITLVNTGRLAAYDLGGSIRFKAIDIINSPLSCARDRVA